MAAQRELSDAQLAKLGRITGCEVGEIARLVQRLQEPGVTRAQQLSWISRLTGRSLADLDQCARQVRQRHRDAQLQPCLARVLRRLRLKRDEPGHTVQCRMPLDRALRLAALLERQCEADGYRYSTALHMTQDGCYEMRVTWRHTSQYQRECYDDLFSGD